MAVTIRYEAEVLLRLRESPLCIKPKDLPPREEWMGYEYYLAQHVLPS